jgi:hypothetical protein
MDGVAIGISQGLYIEAIARDHMEPMVIEYRDLYLNEHEMTELNINPADFVRLKELRTQAFIRLATYSGLYVRSPTKIAMRTCSSILIRLASYASDVALAALS